MDIDDGHDTGSPSMAEPGSASQGTPPPPDDEADRARVAALVARAGLPLTAAEIATLVTEERYDRAGFERLRAMLTPEDEPAHTFQAGRVTRRPPEAHDPSEARGSAEHTREARP